MTIKIEGTLKAKFDTQGVGSNGFIKRDFVVTIDEGTNYPQHISIQLTKDNCAKLDNFNIGDKVEASVNLRGREYDNPTKGLQYFNSLECWKLDRVTGQQPQASAPAQDVTASVESQDLPF